MDAKSKSVKSMTKILDGVVAVVGLALALPVMLVLSALIKLDSRGPILTRQASLATDGRAFALYRFRSTAPDRNGQPQVTRLGRVLRATHLDELPTLLNLFMSEVTFFGPRRHR